MNHAPFPVRLWNTCERCSRARSDRNGVVVGDTAESFAQGLSRILELLAQQNQQIVADGVRKTI